jgi:hypothetical protein
MNVVLWNSRTVFDIVCKPFLDFEEGFFVLSLIEGGCYLCFGSMMQRL